MNLSLMIMALARRPHRGFLPAVATVTAALLGAIVAAAFGGYRINLTPSQPLGLWHIVRLERAAEVGDLVFICPPQTAAIQEALSRGYLRSGLCPSGVAPLIKTVIAVAGQRVEVAA